MNVKSLPAKFNSGFLLNSKMVITAAYYAAYIIIGVQISVLGPALPYLAKTVQAPLGNMSILFTLRALGSIVGALVVGRFFDRGAGHIMLSLMLLLIAGLVSLIPMMPELWMLAILVCTLGLINSSVDVGCNTFLIWVHKEKMEPYMNGLHFFFGIGGLLAPILIAWVLVQTNEISWSFWFLSIAIVPVAIWICSLESPKIRFASEKKEKRLHGSGLGLFVCVIAFISLLVGVEVSFGGWIYSYGLTTGLTDDMGAAYLTSVYWASFTLARLISIPLAIRLKPIQMLFICMIGCLSSLGLILLFAQSLIVLMIGTAGVGMFIASVFPITLSLGGNTASKLET